jgi:hypothetical protein
VSRYLHVQRIEFSVTHRCNAHCMHCHVDEALRRSRPAAIDRELAVEVVRKVVERDHPTSVMTFGGEPFLYPEVVRAIHEAAAASGIPQRQVITNAGLPHDEARARSAARRLAESGVNDIAISVDAFHQEHIPLEVVARNARAYAEAGIPRLAWNPCWLISAEDDNPYNRRTRAILEALSDLPVEMGEGNVVQPDGGAQRWLGSYLPGRIPAPAGSCEDVPYGGRLDQVDCISIEPDGGVSICWDWIIGYAGERDILAILDDYDPYAIPEAKAILEGGVTELAVLLASWGVEANPEGYTSICDMCRSLRRSAREAGLQSHT